MKILFTSSPNLVDWIIKVATGEDCGHMALLFESKAGTGVVFESNLIGCHPAFYKTWMGRKRRIIHQVEVKLTPLLEDALWDRWVETFDGRGYDFGGALFLGLMKIRQRLFGTPLPIKNRWSKRRLYFCDEIYQLLTLIPGLPYMPYDANGMSTPHDLWLVVSGGKG